MSSRASTAVPLTSTPDTMSSLSANGADASRPIPRSATDYPDWRIEELARKWAPEDAYEPDDEDCDE